MTFLILLGVVVVVVVSAVVLMSSQSGSIVGFTIAGMLLSLLGLLIWPRITKKLNIAGTAPTSQGETGMKNFFALNNAKKIMIAAGCGAWVLAISDLLTGNTPSADGRWGWLFAKIFELLGPYGMTAWWIALGSALIFFGVRSKGKE